jgi:CheY-like chemotaxis protein
VTDRENDDDMTLVLVVDDDPMNIYVVEEMLKVKAIACDTALSGSIALRII